MSAKGTAPGRLVAKLAGSSDDRPTDGTPARWPGIIGSQNYDRSAAGCPTPAGILQFWPPLPTRAQIAMIAAPIRKGARLPAGRAEILIIASSSTSDIGRRPRPTIDILRARARTLRDGAGEPYSSTNSWVLRCTGCFRVGSFTSFPAVVGQPFMSGVPPIATKTRKRRICSEGPMCGRLRVGKDFLHECSIGRCSHVFGLLVRFT